MAAAPALTRRLDVGPPAALLGGACVWTLVSAAANGGSPVRTVGVLAASASALVIGALVSRARPWIVPAVVVGGAAMLVLISRAEILSSRPAQGPFGYANATGGFFLQATIAGAMLGLAGPSKGARWAGWIAAGGFAGITVAANSAAAVGLLVLPAAGLVSSKMRRGKAAVAGMAALFAISLFGTMVLGVLAGAPSDRTPGSGIVDQRRKTLWHQAVTLIGEHPLTGVGPEGFAQADPFARNDADARWAHHGFLQFGAETGVLGMGLVVLAFAWLFAAFSGKTDPTALTVLGAAAVAAFGIGSCLDYLMHFPAIPVTVAMLAGSATSPIDA
jgi:O-antigen ligase